MLEPSMRENHADERMREGREVRMIRIGKVVQGDSLDCRLPTFRSGRMMSMAVRSAFSIGGIVEAVAARRCSFSTIVAVSRLTLTAGPAGRAALTLLAPMRTAALGK